jgi:hypothetical protein
VWNNGVLRSMLVSKDKEKKQVVKTRRENGSVY